RRQNLTRRLGEIVSARERRELAPVSRPVQRPADAEIAEWFTGRVEEEVDDHPKWVDVELRRVLRSECAQLPRRKPGGRQACNIPAALEDPIHLLARVLTRGRRDDIGEAARLRIVGPHAEARISNETRSVSRPVTG